MDVHTVSYGMSQTTFKILIKKQFAETSCTITVCVVHKQLTLQPPIHADMIIHAARPKCKAGSALSANEIGPWYVGVLIERYSGVKIINHMIKYKHYNLSHLNIFWKWIQSEIIWPSCSQYCDFISLCCAVFVFPRVLQMPNIYFTTEDTDAVVASTNYFCIVFVVPSNVTEVYEYHMHLYADMILSILDISNVAYRIQW